METEVRTLTPDQVFSASALIEDTWFIVKRSKAPMDVMAYFTADGSYAIRDLSRDGVQLKHSLANGRPMADSWQEFRERLKGAGVVVPEQHVTGQINLGLPALS